MKRSSVYLVLKFETQTPTGLGSGPILTHWKSNVLHSVLPTFGMKVEKLELIVFERSRLSTVSEPDELRIELNVKEVSRLMNSRHDKYLSQNAGQWENAITDLKMRE